MLLDGPEVDGPVAISGSTEGGLVTDVCGDPAESARGGSACLGPERMSVVRDVRDIESGAFNSGSTLLSDVDGGVLGRGWAEEPALSRRFRFVSWTGISSSYAANLFWALVNGMVGVSWIGEIA